MWFPREYQKLIAIAMVLNYYATRFFLKDSRHLLIQLEVRPKVILSGSLLDIFPRFAGATDIYLDV